MAPQNIHDLVKNAEEGDPNAQFNLGVAYAAGEGVHMDLKKAFAWCMKAAQQGSPSAQLYVRDAYEKGLGIRTDLKEAVNAGVKDRKSVV